MKAEYLEKKSLTLLTCLTNLYHMSLYLVMITTKCIINILPWNEGDILDYHMRGKIITWYIVIFFIECDNHHKILIQGQYVFSLYCKFLASQFHNRLLSGHNGNRNTNWKIWFGTGNNLFRSAKFDIKTCCYMWTVPEWILYDDIFFIWLAAGQWFSSTNKPYRHGITEILLKVALNTINSNHLFEYYHNVVIIFSECFFS